MNKRKLDGVLLTALIACGGIAGTSAELLADDTEDRRRSRAEARQSIADEQAVGAEAGTVVAQTKSEAIASETDEQAVDAEAGTVVAETKSEIIAADTESEPAAGEAEPDVIEADEEEVSFESLASQHEAIVQHYVVASAIIAGAQGEMAEALELKRQADKMKAEANALSDDSTVSKKTLKSYTKASQNTNKLIRKKLDKNEELSKEQRQQFVSGVILYSQGMQSSKKVWREAGPFASSVKAEAGASAKSFKEKISSNPLDLLPKSGQKSGVLSKFGTGLYIASSTPKFMKNHSKTLKQIVKYMQDNNIDVPPEATAALSGLDEVEDAESVWGNPLNLNAVQDAMGLPQTECAPGDAQCQSSRPNR